MADYEVRFSNAARKALRRLDSEARERVVRGAEAPGEEPRPRYRIIYKVG